MRTPLILTLTFVSVVLHAGCAILDDGKAGVLKPSQVSASFKDLDKDNPFAKPKSRVDVMKVGIASYDQFFAETATVKGTIVLAEVVMGESDAFAAKIKKEVGAGKVLTPAQARALDKEKKRLEAITKLLTGIPERSGKLTDRSEALAKSAPKTFSGPNAVKLPGVLKGLEQSAKSLKDAVERSPKLIDRAGKSAEKLADLG